jgi:Holliday junction resolvase
MTTPEKKVKDKVKSIFEHTPTTEKKVKAKVKSILDKVGAYYCMPATGGYGASGIPDIIACYKGLFLGIECKANGNKATALQTKHLTLIKQAGGFSVVIDEHNIGTLEPTLKHLQ